MNPERKRKGVLKAKKLIDIENRRGMNYYNNIEDKRFQVLKVDRQPCSCSLCGNKRRHEKGKFKLTRQELTQLEIDKMEGVA